MITLPAQRLHMGSTTYFLASMPAQQLAAIAKSPSKDLPEWDDMSVEDRFQREINTKRLQDEIIPYLASHPDRFFGSVIILVDGNISYERLSDLGVSLPSAYKPSLEKIGFITIDNADFIALDGQHRLVALREILEGRYHGEMQPGIGNDDLSVIFLQNEGIQKTRRIFNKINRYARNTSRSDNLIQSEDDGIAIIARRLFTEPTGEWKSRDPEHLLGSRGEREFHLVNWRTNTLSGRSLQLTTISALSIMVRDICEAHGLALDEKAVAGVRPSNENIARGFDVCQTWFRIFFETFSDFNRARQDVSAIPLLRESGKPYSFLFRPAGQIALFRAARKAKDLLGGTFDLVDFMKRANCVNWSVDAEIWRDIIVVGGQRILAKQNTYEDAAFMILWQILGNSPTLGDDLRKELDRRLKSVNPGLHLPEPLRIESTE